MTGILKPLYTQKGSKIYYSKYGVGKEIGHRIYFHKDYALNIIPTDILWDAQDALYKSYPDFEYNCICYMPRKSIVRFDETPDFNFAREPTVGCMISYNFKENTFSISESSQIWHHKWLWVEPNYTDFNVGESYKWSKIWLSKLQEPASGFLDIWKKQLKTIGLK